ncbi:response regulator transcription factor [Desertihabitans aurantiacus]|uniref:response regulator transcription factor n=1 Tax=Desertihabitans aurantiacus TaxID=2282477 RepID=UPI000DF7C390|nr:response regulator transcription factor [Desertihabitans aurantiacus]
MDSAPARVSHEPAGEAQQTITVGIADDNAVVRMGIAGLLATTPDIEVVGEVGDGAAAIALVRSRRPTVMLLDVRMPRQDGVSAAAEIAASTNVLMLTYSESSEVVTAAVRAGAKGYLVHGHFTEVELVNAVRMAARGTGTFSAAALSALSDPRPAAQVMAERFGLSEREAEVMTMIAAGTTNAGIASALFISEKTVKNHINRIFAKLHVSHRSQAISLWLTGR